MVRQKVLARKLQGDGSGVPAGRLVSKNDEFNVHRGDEQDARVQGPQVQEASVAQHSARHKPVLLPLWQQPLRQQTLIYNLYIQGQRTKYHLSSR